MRRFDPLERRSYTFGTPFKRLARPEASTKVEAGAATRDQRSVFSHQVDQKQSKISAGFSVCWKHFSAFRGEVIDKESMLAGGLD